MCCHRRVPASTNAATDNKLSCTGATVFSQTCFQEVPWAPNTCHPRPPLSGIVARCVRWHHVYLSCEVNSESCCAQVRVGCVRLTTERTQPQTSNRAASFSFSLPFIPWLRVPGPVFYTGRIFANTCDASAVSCVVTRFPPPPLLSMTNSLTVFSVSGRLLPPPDYFPWLPLSVPLPLPLLPFPVPSLCLQFLQSFINCPSLPQLWQIRESLPRPLPVPFDTASTSSGWVPEFEVFLSSQRVRSCGRCSCATDVDHFSLEVVPFFQPLGVHHEVWRKLTVSQPVQDHSDFQCWWPSFATSVLESQHG